MKTPRFILGFQLKLGIGSAASEGYIHWFDSVIDPLNKT